MKILFLGTHFVQGAAERLAAELAVSLNDSGVTAHLLSIYARDYPGADMADMELRRRGVPAIEYLGLSPHPSPGSVVRAILKVRHIVASGGYDAVETSSATPGLIASMAVGSLRVLHVVGIHFVFDGTGPESLAARTLRRLARLRRRCVFYGVSQAARDAWITHAGIDPRRVSVLLNSIDSRFFLPTPPRAHLRTELQVDSDSFFVLVVGRLSTYKRQDLVFAALKPVCVDANIVVGFVGDTDTNVPGSAAMVSDLQRSIAEHNLNNHFQFFGFRHDLPELMASGDVLVHAANKEAFGLVLAEALAVGLPVISADIEGCREVLADTDAVLIEPDNPEALRNAVLQVRSAATGQIDRERSRGRARARLFTREARARAFLDLVRSYL